MSTQVAISAQTLLEYANRADLARVKGIGARFSDLLESAGVDTVKELATRHPVNLHTKLLALMTDAPRISKPSVTQVEGWSTQATNLGTGLDWTINPVPDRNPIMIAGRNCQGWSAIVRIPVIRQKQRGFELEGKGVGVGNIKIATRCVLATRH